MAATPHDGSGTTLTFSGASYTVTGITYNRTDTQADDTLDVSHLGLASGDDILTQARPLVGSGNDTGKEITIDFIGSSAPAVGTEGTLDISGGISVSENSRCTASTITLAVNDVIRGSATFRVGVSS
jgi:hypothetical protein